MTEEKHEIPRYIQVRNARVHNLKNIDVNIPLNRIVGIAGVSGSGKSSLAFGILYAEGSRRYLESLSTYTRRRMTQATRANVDDVLYIPAALALKQRPGVPDIRSTFGTGTELLNGLRLIFSRLASHRCPNGHYVQPSLNVAAEQELICPECGAHFFAPSAEDLSFNSSGACKTCNGTGTVRTVDESTLVPDESLTIDEGAVAPWQTLMWSLMKDIAREMGVRTDVPFKDLTDKEKDIVFHGPAVKKHMLYQNKTSGTSGDMDFTYYNAIYTVENALSKVKNEKGMKRVAKFLKQDTCPDCKGSRLSSQARAPRICGMSLSEACKMPLNKLVEWVKGIPSTLPDEMEKMGEQICESFTDTSLRLLSLGLDYISLDRPSSTLSNGERQRMQLARAVRNRTTGVLYILDEPSIGLHPSNLEGVKKVMQDLIDDGNSVILVDHNVNILSESDWIVELGPEGGSNGGNIIAEGTIEDIVNNDNSRIGKYLLGKSHIEKDMDIKENDIFKLGSINLSTDNIHTVKPLDISFPKGRMTVVTGVSGSGKTTLVLESLVPALEAILNDKKMPSHVKSVEADGISEVKLIDSTPIGINVRSTVATYSNIHDKLRKEFAKTSDAKERKYKSGDFSYNTGKLKCSTCDGTGSITLDVQFLPDVEITCPDCGGSRYSDEAREIYRQSENGHKYTLPDLMELSVDEALNVCSDIKSVHNKLEVLHDLGLGYLTLGEQTPVLSGGEAQRLKLASELKHGQSNSLFVFDEPTIGLHPLDVKVLLDVFRQLVDNGATLIVIEHDLDVIRNADYIVDLGPGGGLDGGRIVAKGTPSQIKDFNESITAKYI